MQQVASGDNARCNKPARLKPGTAAQELGINRSSLKRYLDQYPELLGDDGKVELEQLRQHRADNPNVADAVRKVEQRQTARPKAADSGGGRTLAKSRLDETKAIQADLDLAERLNQVVDPGEIVDAISEAGNYLRERFTTADPIMCERLAAEGDPRQIKAIIEEESRKVMAECEAKFAAAAKLVPEPKAVDQTRQSDESV